MRMKNGEVVGMKERSGEAYKHQISMCEIPTQSETWFKQMYGDVWKLRSRYHLTLELRDYWGISYANMPHTDEECKTSILACIV
jgi:hypothetical protein